MCSIVRSFFRQGWCPGASGTFSATLQEDSLQLLISRTGCNKERLVPEDLVVISADGKMIDQVSGAPSSESLLHGMVATVAQAKSVMHTHTVWNTLLGERTLGAGGFTLTGYEMLKGLAGVDTHEIEVFVPVVENTQDIPALANRVAEVMAEWPGSHGFLIAGHGLYTWGNSLEQAARHVETFEFLFECEGRKVGFGDPR